MIILPTHIISLGSNDKDSILHNLRGITEEEEDKEYIIPMIIYKFFNGKFNYNSFKISYKYNMAEYVIEGSLVNEDKLSKINLSVSLSTFHRVFIAIFYLLPFLTYISGGLDEINEVLFVWFFWSVGLFINFIIVKWKIKNIFKTIMTAGFSKDQSKYNYMD